MTGARFAGDDFSFVHDEEFGTASVTSPPLIDLSQQGGGFLSGEPLDLWQAPTNFEWEDWAGFVGRFRAE